MAWSRRWFGFLAGAVVLLCSSCRLQSAGSRRRPESVPQSTTQLCRSANASLPSAMRDISMIAHFTLDGLEGQRTDEYDISSVEKVGDDRWRFNARIGEVDATLPVAVTMRWLEDPQ